MNIEPLQQQIETLLSNFQSIPATRKYWLVRTLGGKYYDSFREYKYIALGHDEIKYSVIDDIRRNAKNDNGETLKGLRALCETVYNKDSRPGLIASQIFKFIFEIKKNDIVVIPSEHSEEIAIGVVASTASLEVSESEINKTDCPFTKRKRIKWTRTISRQDLDPYLFKVLQAHQAINEITHYSDTIERTIGNFYIKENSGNLVLDIATNDGINAVDLFQLGYCLLNYSKDFFKESNLPYSINDVEVKINLNSKGKIQFKSPDGKTVWLIALLVIAINGGGIKFKAEGVDFDLSTEGIVKKIIEYQNNKHDRAMTDTIIKSINSLKVQSPEDAVKVFEQFNTNKK